MVKEQQLILTCEHGGNGVPDNYLYLFEEFNPILKSHWAYDQGALDLAEFLSKEFSVRLFRSTITRLLVDLNRSLTSPGLFSDNTKLLKASEKQDILNRYYHPYRNAILSEIIQGLKKGNQIFHLSIHTFTPVYQHEIRQGDIGLLYDPKRGHEKSLVSLWQSILKSLRSDLVVRKNYPYLGKSDGLTSHFRKIFQEQDYIGIELEVNQKHYFHVGESWTQLKQDLETSLWELFQILY